MMDDKFTGEVIGAEITAMHIEITTLRAQRDELAARLDAAECLIGEAAQDVEFLKQTNHALKYQRDELAAALLAIEWIDEDESNYKFCPWCHSVEQVGHESDCQRQAALAGLPAEAGEAGE